jgi:hypothetical protein
MDTDQHGFGQSDTWTPELLNPRTLEPRNPWTLEPVPMTTAKIAKGLESYHEESKG